MPLTPKHHAILNRAHTLQSDKSEIIFRRLRRVYKDDQTALLAIDIYDGKSEYSRLLFQLAKANVLQDTKRCTEIYKRISNIIKGLPAQIHGELYQMFSALPSGKEAGNRFKELRTLYRNNLVAQEQLDVYESRFEYLKRWREYRDVLKEYNRTTSASKKYVLKRRANKLYREVSSAYPIVHERDLRFLETSGVA